jgi:hypothetical protein
MGHPYEDDVRAVRVAGGLSHCHSLGDGSFMVLLLNAVVPGVLTVGDLPDLLAA